MQPHVSSPSCLVDEHTSSNSGDTMSGPGVWPSTHHCHSWNCPGPTCAHARYCPLWPLSPTLCTASGPVQKPAPCSCFLGFLGSPGQQPKPCLGARLEHSGWADGSHILSATCGQHARPQAVGPVALSDHLPDGCAELNSPEALGCGVASQPVLPS